MNDNAASGVGRLNKSPVAGRFRPNVGRKEKNFLEEVREEARAQRKASERIDLEKLGSNNTEMDSEKPRVLEAPVLAEGRMGSRDYTKSTPSSLRAAVERMRRGREKMEKIDWDKVLTSKRMRSGDKPRVLEAPVLAEGRMGSRDYTSLRAAVERMRRGREKMEKIDWDKVITSKRMRMRSGDYTKSKEASASYGKTVLPEASASCDKMDSDHLA